MGDIAHPETVVDSSFRVKGAHNLRVCDASVIPVVPSFPTAATCFAMGNILGRILQSPSNSHSSATSKDDE